MAEEPVPEAGIPEAAVSDAAASDAAVADAAAAGNVALGKTVTSSSSYDAEGWGKPYLVDGSKTGPDLHALGFTTFPAAGQPPAGSPAWVMIDLGNAYSIDRAALWPRSDNGVSNVGMGFPVDFKVLASADGAAWTTLYETIGYPTPSDGRSLEISFSKLQARYVRVEATRLQADNFNQTVLQLREMEVFLAPNDMPDQEVVDRDAAELTIGETENVSTYFTLPTYGAWGSVISWSSSDPSVADATGRVVRPAAGEPPAAVTLTATIRSGSVTAEKAFSLTVKPHKLREPEREEFTVGVFWPPTWEYTNEQQYQWLQEANVDVLQNVLGSGLDTEERNVKMLDLAERYGLKVNVADPRIRGTDQQIAEVVNTYKNYWGTAGYYIRDEPGIPELPAHAHMYHEVLKHDGEKNPYVNLLPNIYGDRYEPDYVRAFVELVGADRLKYLSYDNYPFLANNAFDNGWYDTADIIRRVGLAYDVKTGSYLQSVGYGSSPTNVHHRDPSEADMRFNVYSYLAYGFKYVTWFTYWTPTNRGEHFENAIIDPEGNKTAKYEPFQRLNGEMKQLGKTLIRLDAKEVYHTGATMPTASAKRLPDNFYLSPANAADETLVSYLVHKDTARSYVIIVNKSLTDSKTLTLKADPRVGGVNEVSKVDGAEAPAAGYDAKSRTLTNTFLPGEGKLYALVGNIPEYVGPQKPTVLEAPSSDDRHPLSNLAAGGRVEASSDIKNWGWHGDNLVDGKRVGESGDFAPKGWTSQPSMTQPASPEWVGVDLGAEYLVERVVLWPRNDNGTNLGLGFPVDYKVQVSNDRQSWTTAVAMTGAALPSQGEATELTFEATPARYVRVEASKLRTDPFGDYVFQLAELEVYQQDPGTRLRLQAGTTELVTGQTTTLRVERWKDDGTLEPVQGAAFVSSRPDVAVVDADGRVTAIAPGTADIEISATTEDGTVDSREVRLTVRSLEAPWSLTTFGGAEAAIASAAGGFEVAASGAFGDAGAERFAFLHQAGQGKRQALTGTIRSFGIPDAAGGIDGRSGLLFRQTDKGTTDVFLSVSPEGRLELRSAASDDKYDALVQGDYAPLPVELKLVQDGNRFTGYYKKDGAWLPIAGDVEASTAKVKMSDEWQAGFAAYSNAEAAFQRTTVDGLTLTALPPNPHAQGPQE